MRLAALRRLARRSLPQTGGTIRLACLDAPVEVIRDRFGIPHVYAGGRLDLARAQGYVHAQDRLFQMETLRRFAFGRLSELAGRRTLELDRTARRLLLRQTAERNAAACDPETHAVVEAYCEGVNAFLAHGPLPLELRLLRVRPEPWTPVDVQAPAQTLAVGLSGNWQLELLRARLRERLGDERFGRFRPVHPEGHPVHLSEELLAEGLRGARGGEGASNAFALAGARTASGRPLVANDPHLLLGIPAIWHVQHLEWDGGMCAGVTVPGAPVVVLGRNRRLAWGMTTAMVDTQDLFLERFDPESPRRYEADGAWLDAEVVREPIRVRGRRAAVVEEVVVTRHGPLVAGPDPERGEALALRWSHHEPGETLQALLELADAGSVVEADAALDRFAGPPHSFALADAAGVIGYRLAGGPIPRRSAGDGSLPVPGWDSTHEWDGFVPAGELPRLHDPASGVVVTANNRIGPPGSPQDFPGEYLSGYRAARLAALLAEREGLTSRDCERILLDRHSLPGLELVEALDGLAAGTDPLEERALRVLRRWDGDLAAESPGGAVYGALMGALEREAYADAEPAELPIGIYERGRPGVLRALTERDDGFFPCGSCREAVRRALAAAVRELGPDPSRWRRGGRHRLRLAHALDAVPGLRTYTGRGPFPAGGDGDTVNVLAAAPAAGRDAMIGPALRAIWDLGNDEEARIALCPGQSGHPESPHYDDLLPGWLRGEYVPLALSRRRVEELAEARLELVASHDDGAESARR
jgi:penicillin G amidase